MVRFDPTTHAALETMIRSSFPDAHIDDDSINGLAAALWLTKDSRTKVIPRSQAGESGKAKDLDLSPYAQELEGLSTKLGLRVIEGTGECSIHCQAGTEHPGTRYYAATAEHSRKDPPLDAFVGHLAMARVSLPASQPAVVETKLGTVEPRDHLIATIAEAQREYGSELDRPIARLDLVTPARLGGTRFGAIGVYLGYFDPAGLPEFYILEAGTAIGESKVLYFHDVGDDLINSYTGYRPTPFSNPMHAYVGRLTLDGDAPARLQVTARRLADAKPYIRLDVRFTETADPEVVWPAFHILRALGIVVSRLPLVPMG